MHTRFFVLILLAAAGVVLSPASQAQNFSVLYQFCSQADCSDGSLPTGGLVRDSGGNLYGTTWKGGDAGCGGGLGCGTVFKLAPDGTETVLHAFTVLNDGDYPLGGLVIDKAGNLYGTTTEGGNMGCNGESGCGTVFKVAPEGTETVLYVFGGSPDGAEPMGRLVMDLRGNLFGTTFVGGAYGAGTVFKLAETGVETVRYSFKGGSDGQYPSAGLLIDANHNQFGTTTSGGGGRECAEGCGTVFKLAPDDSETVLYAFQGPGYPQTDGSYPYGDLIKDGAGNLYGTTSGGGSENAGCYTYGGCGTLFRIAPDGTETILHDFHHDNRFPVAGLVMDKAANLYGTTSDNGGVFRLRADGGGFRFLHEFSGDDGYYAAADLLKGPNGDLYGTTADGGTNGGGTVFVIKK